MLLKPINVLNTSISGIFIDAPSWPHQQPSSGRVQSLLPLPPATHPCLLFPIPFGDGGGGISCGHTPGRPALTMPSPLPSLPPSLPATTAFHSAHPHPPHSMASQTSPLTVILSAYIYLNPIFHLYWHRCHSLGSQHSHPPWHWSQPSLPWPSPGPGTAAAAQEVSARHSGSHHFTCPRITQQHTHSLQHHPVPPVTAPPAPPAPCPAWL